MALRLKGQTSGYVELNAPAAAGSNTLTLPDGNGSAGQYLQTNGGGTLSWQTVASLSNAEDGTGTNFEFNSGYGSNATAYGVRAWVCFNGNNGTVLEDGNVSSITDNATGNYTINFATNMPDSNYAAAGNSDGNSTNSCNFGPPAVGSIGMKVYNVSGQLGDHDKVFAIIVR